MELKKRRARLVCKEAKPCGPCDNDAKQQLEAMESSRGGEASEV